MIFRCFTPQCFFRRMQKKQTNKRKEKDSTQPSREEVKCASTTEKEKLTLAAMRFALSLSTTTFLRENRLFFFSLPQVKTIHTILRALQNTHLSMFCIELSNRHVGFENF